MKISHKLQKLVDQGLISQKQAEKIMISEQAKHSNLAWKLMYWIAGLFIGLGVILLIASNWRHIPDSVKLLGDFAIWGGILYGTYWTIINKKENLKELFLTLSFFFVAATIGLIAQIFHLSGGWHSFAITWSLLGIVFVLFSRLMTLNIIWLWLFLGTIDFSFLIDILEPFIRRGALTAVIAGTILFALLSYAGTQLYKALEKVIVLPKAFALLSSFFMYLIAIAGGAILGFEQASLFSHSSPFLANAFVFLFLGIRLLLAIQKKNMKSFIRNTHLVELYILFLFFTRYGGLFRSGLGFILAGCILLASLYALRKTSKYIKKMEMFHE